MNAAITTAANGLKRSLSATPFVMKMNLASDEERRGASAPGLLAFLATHHAALQATITIVYRLYGER
jgi:hypothetical protein